MKNGFHYIGNCIRPPSEANSILIQATTGCSHNKCIFCGSYENKKFTIKDKEIIKEDLKFAHNNCIYQNRLFVMDGDAFIMPFKYWEWLLTQIKSELPWVTRIGTYCNSKSVKLKNDEQLKIMKKLGLKIVYYGIETGHPFILNYIRKGSSPENLIKQGLRLKKAGFKLSVTVLLGIGSNKFSLEHAQETGKILSKIDPDFVGVLTLIPLPNTPLFEDINSGNFIELNQKELLIELHEMINYTNLSSGLFYSNHASNYLPIKARLPEDRENIMKLIRDAIKNRIPLKPEHYRAL